MAAGRSGTWQLVLCGTSHKTSTLEQREPFQIATHEMAAANACLRDLAELKESLILSTCNRIEFYIIHEGQNDPLDSICRFYDRFRESDIIPRRGLFHVQCGTQAAAHLFRVAAGIDSMVLGENQILGQVKDAYSSACAVKSAGKVLHRLFHQAFRVGKQVRSDTEMGRGACSVSTAAVEMLKAKIDALDRPAILFVGVNQMIQMAAMKLARIEHARLTFANRSPEKAASLAAKYAAESHGLERLTDLIAGSDVVMSCTSSTEPIITRQMLNDLVQRRESGTCILMDLAIPRDIDCARKRDTMYEVYDLEDVRRFVEREQNRRVQAIPQAEEIIESRLREFAYWYEHVQNELVYSGNGQALEAAREEELAPLLEKLPPALREEAESVSRKLLNRIVRIMQRTESGME